MGNKINYEFIMCKIHFFDKFIVDRITERAYTTKSGSKINIPQSFAQDNSNPRIKPVANGKAFREQKRKQAPEKGCMIRLRFLIAKLEAEEVRKNEEYARLRAQGYWPEPVRDSNLLKVLKIILEVREDEEKELLDIVVLL